jgi:deoxyribonuclease-1
MRTKFWLATALFLLAAPALGQSPERFGAAKKLLADIHDEIGHLATVYCGCPYVRTSRSGGNIDRKTCGLEARKNEERSDRVEWEHVVPASWFGSNRTCWQSGHEFCMKKSGKSFKGRECCLKPGVDPAFLAAHNDPHNLFPAGGEVNGDRLNHPYGTVEGEARMYGTCDFEVGGSPKVAEPAASVRGELARAMLYMAERYEVDVRMTHEELMGWHESDPPDDWETERARRIETATGLQNPYIDIP